MHTISSMDELYALDQDYERRVAWGWSGHIELLFKPGHYAIGFLFNPRLHNRDRPYAIDITLRGVPGVTIVAPSRLRTPRLVLESLQVQLVHRAEWEIGEAISMRDVVVADGRGYSMDGYGKMLGILARGRDRSLPARFVTATLADCWFLRNDGERAMSLLSFDTVPRTRVLWSKIDIRDSGFIGNVVGVDVSLRLALNVTIQNTIWHSPYEKNLLIQNESSDRITLQRSLLLVTDRDQVARHHPSGPPITLEADVRVLSEAPPPSGDEPNPGYRAPPTVHEVIAADDPRAARLRALTGVVGGPIDRDALRAARDDLLKP